MAWIELIDEDEAEGVLAREYKKARRRAGKVFQILKVMSRGAESLRASMGLYQAVMFSPGGLSRAEREAAATFVSAHNRCLY